MNILERIDNWAIENPMEIALTNKILYKQFIRFSFKRQTEICPFCNEYNCNHWDGIGWNNPK